MGARVGAALNANVGVYVGNKSAVFAIDCFVTHGNHTP